MLTAVPMLRGLAGNPALPADLLDRMVTSADAELATELAGSARLSPAQAGQLARIGGTDTRIRLVRRGLLGADQLCRSEPLVVLALLDEAAVPADRALELIGHPDPSIRADLATVPRLTADLLVRLADDEDPDVVAEVALRADLTPELAETLARHPHATVRAALARNERTPPHLLAALAADGGRPALRHCHACQGHPDRQYGRWCDGAHEGAVLTIQIATVTNPATPAAALTGFPDHPDTLLRSTLATRPDLLPTAYQRLARDPVLGVRCSLAANPVIGELLMRRLAPVDDNWHEVRRQLAENPALPLDLLAGLAQSTRIGATLLPRVAGATTDEVLVLAESTVPAVRMLLALRPDLPEPVVRRLAADPDAKVLKAIAPNPAVSEEQLWAMVERHGNRVAAAVARNPNCGPDLLLRLVARDPSSWRLHREVARHPNTGPEALRSCLAHERVRPLAARHPGLPVPVLLELLVDPEEEVVVAVAGNPALPRTAMEAALAGEPFDG